MARRLRFKKSRKFSRRSRKKGIKRLARKVQGYLGELKYGESTQTGAVSYSGTILSLTDIAQGDLDTQRDGDSLTLSSLQVKGHWVTADAYNVCRLIIFQWLKDDTSAPAATDILLNVGNIYAPESMLNHDKRFLYRILYDKTVIVHTYKPAHYFKFKLRKFPRRYIQYQAGTTTGINKLYALYISDSSAVSHPSIYFDNKLLYKDS